MGFPMKVKKIMTDFEKSLRNALLQILFHIIEYLGSEKYEKDELIF